MTPKFVITQEDVTLGVVNTSLALITDVKIPLAYPDALECICRSATHRALHYTDADLFQSPELRGFRDLYKNLGYDPKRVRPAAEDFVRLVRKRERAPKINAAVDAYNSVVLETLMGIGAHDYDSIDGPVVFTRAKGGEHFTPLGSDRPKPLPQGDFIYMDRTKVLARLASDDCEEAKIKPHTSRILLVIEAHNLVSQASVTDVITEACRRITSFCGGTYSVFWPELAGG